jgi:hypothetical protein
MLESDADWLLIQYVVGTSRQGKTHISSPISTLRQNHIYFANILSIQVINISQGDRKGQGVKNQAARGKSSSGNLLIDCEIKGFEIVT